MWFDLFTYMFAQPNTQVLLRSAATYTTEPGDYLEMVDPTESLVLREESSPESMYRPPETIALPAGEVGGALSVEYDRNGDGTIWRGESFYFFINRNSAFDLVGKRVRVRTILVGEPDTNAPIPGVGSSGFIFIDQADARHRINTSIVNHSTEAVDGLAASNTPSPWYEHEVTLADITPESVNQEFVGLGSIGLDADADPPLFIRCLYEWQVWIEESESVPPWWMCPVREPVEPCPVRPTTFTTFAEYDSDFKFPLSSSRVPAENPRPTDCISCRPNVVDSDEST